MNQILLGIGIIVLVILFFVMLSGIRFIPNNRIGMIEKRWSGKGSVKGGLIALQGEAGYQPQILRGGLHYEPWNGCDQVGSSAALGTNASHGAGLPRQRSEARESIGDQAVDQSDLVISQLVEVACPALLG